MKALEKKYSKHIGQLYWSVRHRSLVMLTDLTKLGSRWRYQVQYLRSDMGYIARTRDAKEIERLLEVGKWITAEKMLEYKEAVEKSLPNP